MRPTPKRCRRSAARGRAAHRPQPRDRAGCPAGSLRPDLAARRALDETRRVGHAIAAGDDLEALADLTEARNPTVAAEPIEGLERCLATLDKKKRACVIEAYVEGRTHEEIAAKLAVPLGSVKTWIRRGLLALEECLS